MPSRGGVISVSWAKQTDDEWVPMEELLVSMDASRTSRRIPIQSVLRSVLHVEEGNMAVGKAPREGVGETNIKVEE